MENISGISNEKLKFKIIAFDMEDVLVPGRVLAKIEKEKIFSLLEALHALEAKITEFKLLLISGFSEEEGRKKLAENALEKFFKKENIHFLGKEHINKMQSIDRERYLENISKNPLFQDDYFKQGVLKELADNYGKERIILIGHDLLTDAYYSQRFSGVSVALVKKALSLKHEKQAEIVKGIIYVNLDWNDFRKLLLGKKPNPKIFFLNKFIEDYLQRELIGGLKIDASAIALKKSNNN